MKTTSYAAALGLACIIAAPASATIATLTVTGIVTSVVDRFGELGTYQPSWIGSPFTATFTINPDKAGASVFRTPIGYSVSGESPSVPVSASVSVLGQQYNFGSNFGIAGLDYGSVRQVFAASDSSVYIDQNPNDPKTQSFLVSVRNESPAFPSQSDFSTSFSYSVLPTDSATGRITFIDYVDGPGASPLNRLLVIELAPQRLSLSIAAVPEPATWAMMLVGFGAIGTAMRRRPKHLLAMA